MKLKKLLLSLVLVGFAVAQTASFAANVSDSAIRMLVSKYKAHNYLGCIQDSETILKTNPSNVFALYYKGLAYTQLGKKEEAIETFEKVKTLNTSSQLTQYATKGIACLNNSEECRAGDSNELDAFIKSNKFYDQSVQTEVNKKKLERIKENINDELAPKKSEAEAMPTNDEIAQAVKTLAKIGLNPMANQATGGMYAQNPEMMQMNMLLGNNSNHQNNSMDMIQMLMMNQNGKQNISPELIQTMMMSQMNPDFSNNTY